MESLCLLLPVQEALWGKPRSSKANKRSAARLLHEPLSYNTAGFLFSCLNTFYTLSARTRLNNRTQGGETREDKRLVQRQNASNHNKSNVASNPVCESWNRKSVSFHQNKWALSLWGAWADSCLWSQWPASSAAALRDSCSMVIIPYLNNEAAPPVLPPIPSASLTGLFDRH